MIKKFLKIIITGIIGGPAIIVMESLMGVKVHGPYIAQVIHYISLIVLGGIFGLLIKSKE